MSSSPAIAILLIEDHPSEAQLIRELLEENPQDCYRVTHVDTLSHGLLALSRGHFQVVLLDLNLPDSLGMETLHAIREHHPQLPIVILTNLDDKELALEGVRRGAQDFLVKSVLQLNPSDFLSRSVRYAIERQRTHVQLEESQSGFRHLVEKVVDGMLVVDKAGMVRFCNPAVDEIFGRSALRVGDEFGFLVVTGQTTELDILPPGQTECRVVEMRVAEIQWEGETAYLASLRDITQRKRVEEELRRAKIAAEQANQAKSQFFAMMSHEIRTPMNAIIGMADLMSQESLTEEQSQATRVIIDSGRALLILINDILDLAKIESGEFTTQAELFSPRDLMESVYSIMQVPAERQKGLALSCRVDAKVPMAVQADYRRIRQVMINLVGNAIKFTDQGSIRIVLEMSFADAEPRLLFSVADTGIGIAADKLGAIFGIFAQADDTIYNRYGGTGLGLAISKRLVEIMRGTIWAESTPGEGSVFYFSLPAQVLELGSTGGEACPADPSKDASDRDMNRTFTGIGSETRQRLTGMPVLVVEDDPLNQLVILKMLKKIGVEPELAVNGREALQMTATKPYALVLMDVHMPEMDGISAVRLLREREAESDLPHANVVAMTAFAMEEDKQRCLDAGMDDYLCKPIRHAELINLVLRCF
ncbi:MAG: response regulator [Magnetococcus sp. YQC-9]